jgi:hypothetical protein
MPGWIGGVIANVLANTAAFKPSLRGCGRGSLHRSWKKMLLLLNMVWGFAGWEGREQVLVFAQAPALGGGTSEVLLDVRLPPHIAANNRVFAVKQAGDSLRRKAKSRRTGF